MTVLWLLPNADFVICLILCLNLGSHWLLAREVSAAKQGVVERNADEDRQLERTLALKKADVELANAQAAAANAERRRLAQLPVSQRRSAAPKPEPKPEPTKAATIQPLSFAPSGAIAMSVAPVVSPLRLTPEQVREKWWLWLTALAFAEVFASVLAGAILAGVWEWDRNPDGIADDEQKPAGAGARPGKN